LDPSDAEVKRITFRDEPLMLFSGLVTFLAESFLITILSAGEISSFRGGKFVFKTISYVKELPDDGIA
jgi:hypothetical protein